MEAIETKRLVLRELGKCDITALFKIYSDERTMRYTDTEPILEISEIENEINFVNELAKSGKGFRVGLFKKSDDILIGTSGYHKWNRTVCKAEIGFEIASTFWRKGYE